MKFILPLLLAILLWGCDHQKPIEQTPNSFSLYPVKIDSPVFKEYYQFIKQGDSMFNLPVLFNGADSFELRIWPYHAFNPHKQVYIFKADSLGWTGFHYFSNTLPLLTPDGAIKKFYDSFKVGEDVFFARALKPLCGWDKFYDSILYFKIPTLPTQSLIQNFKDHHYLDGDGYSLEIATSRSYHLLSYSNPYYYDYSECKLFCGFIDMLRRQLPNNYSWKTKLPGRD